MSTKSDSALEHSGFATLLSFLDNFGHHIGLPDVSYSSLESFLNGSRDNIESFVKLHVKLLRGIGNTSVTPSNWEKKLEKYCQDFPDGDDEALQAGGYQSLTPSARLRILNNLLDEQFEYNNRFNEKVNEPSDLNSLRQEPLGRDKFGRLYWYFLDDEFCLRVYREWRDVINDEYSWELVCQDEDELQEIIDSLEKEEPPKQNFKGMKWKLQKQIELKLHGVKEVTVDIDKLDDELVEKLSKSSLKLEEIESYLSKSKAKRKFSDTKLLGSYQVEVASKTDDCSKVYDSLEKAGIESSDDGKSRYNEESDLEKKRDEKKHYNESLKEDQMEVDSASDTKSMSEDKSESLPNEVSNSEAYENRADGKKTAGKIENESSSSASEIESDCDGVSKNQDKYGEKSILEKYERDCYSSGGESEQGSEQSNHSEARGTGSENSAVDMDDNLKSKEQSEDEGTDSDCKTKRTESPNIQDERSKSSESENELDSKISDIDLDTSKHSPAKCESDTKNVADKSDSKSTDSDVSNLSQEKNGSQSDSKSSVNETDSKNSDGKASKQSLETTKGESDSESSDNESNSGSSESEASLHSPEISCQEVSHSEQKCSSNVCSAQTDSEIESKQTESGENMDTEQGKMKIKKKVSKKKSNNSSQWLTESGSGNEGSCSSAKKVRCEPDSVTCKPDTDGSSSDFENYASKSIEEDSLSGQESKSHSSEPDSLGKQASNSSDIGQKDNKSIPGSDFHSGRGSNSDDDAKSMKEISSVKDSSHKENTTHERNHLSQDIRNTDQESGSESRKKCSVNGFSDQAPYNPSVILVQDNGNGSKLCKKQESLKIFSVENHTKHAFCNGEPNVTESKAIVQNVVTCHGQTETIPNEKSAICRQKSDLIKTEPHENEVETKPLFEKFITSGALKQNIKKNLADIKREIKESLQQLHNKMSAKLPQHVQSCSPKDPEHLTTDDVSTVDLKPNSKGSSKRKNDSKSVSGVSSTSKDNGGSSMNSSSHSSSSESEVENDVDNNSSSESTFKIIDQGEKVNTEIDLIISDAIGEYRTEQNEIKSDENITLDSSDISNDSVIITKTEVKSERGSENESDSLNADIDDDNDEKGKADQIEMKETFISENMTRKTNNTLKQKLSPEQLDDPVSDRNELLDWNVELNPDYNSDDNSVLSQSGQSSVDRIPELNKDLEKEQISIDSGESDSENEPLSKLKTRQPKTCRSKGTKSDSVSQKNKSDLCSRSAQANFMPKFLEGACNSEKEVQSSHERLGPNKPPTAVQISSQNLSPTCKTATKSALLNLLSKPLNSNDQNKPLKFVYMTPDQLANMSKVHSSVPSISSGANLHSHAGISQTKPPPFIPKFVYLKNSNKVVPIEEFRKPQILWNQPFKSLLSQPVVSLPKVILPKVVNVATNSGIPNPGPDCYITKFDVGKPQLAKIVPNTGNFMTKFDIANKQNIEVKSINGTKSVSEGQDVAGRQKKKKRGRPRLIDVDESSADSDSSFEQLLQEAEKDDESEPDEADPDDAEYDYHTLSNRVKAAASKNRRGVRESRYSRLGMRKDQPITFSSDEVDDDEDEKVPYIVGRNAQRLAARNKSYKEVNPEIIEDDPESEEIEVEELSDTPCQVCGRKDNLELLLMCDDCDDCYHATCLSPPIMVVPPDDWYCPACDHERLLTAMKNKLSELLIELKKYQSRMHRKRRQQAFRERFLLRSQFASNGSSEDKGVFHQGLPMGTNFGLSLDNILMEDGPRSTRSRVPVKYTTEEYDKKFSEALKEAMDKNKPEKPEKTARSGRKTRSYKEESDSEVTEGSELESDSAGSKDRKKKHGLIMGHQDRSNSDDSDSDLNLIRKETYKRRSSRHRPMTRGSKSDTQNSDMEKTKVEKSKRKGRSVNQRFRTRKHKKGVLVSDSEDDEEQSTSVERNRRRSKDSRNQHSDSDSENSKVEGNKRKSYVSKMHQKISSASDMENSDIEGYRKDEKSNLGSETEDMQIDTIRKDKKRVRISRKDSEESTGEKRADKGQLGSKKHEHRESFSEGENNMADKIISEKCQKDQEKQKGRKNQSASDKECDGGERKSNKKGKEAKKSPQTVLSDSSSEDEVDYKTRLNGMKRKDKVCQEGDSDDDTEEEIDFKSRLKNVLRDSNTEDETDCKTRLQSMNKKSKTCQESETNDDTEEEIGYKTRLENTKMKGSNSKRKGKSGRTEAHEERSKERHPAYKQRGSGSNTENSEEEKSESVTRKMKKRTTRKTLDSDSVSDNKEERRKTKVSKNKKKKHVDRKSRHRESSSDEEDSRNEDIKHNRMRLHKKTKENESKKDFEGKTRKTEGQQNKKFEDRKRDSSSDTDYSEIEINKTKKIEMKLHKKRQENVSASDSEYNEEDTKVANKKQYEGSRNRCLDSKDKEHKGKHKKPRLTLSGDEEAAAMESDDSDYINSDSTDSEDDEWDKMYVRKERRPSGSENDKEPYITRSGRSTNSSSRIKKFL